MYFLHTHTHTHTHTHMCVCVCVCMYVCMCVCMYVCLYKGVSARFVRLKLRASGPASSISLWRFVALGSHTAIYVSSFYYIFVSLWRFVALDSQFTCFTSTKVQILTQKMLVGTRHDGRIRPHTGSHRLQLYLTDKGGNDLGVRRFRG